MRFKNLLIISLILTFVKYALMNSLPTEDKIPLYLSIEVDHQINKRQIFEFILNNLMNLVKKYPQNTQIKADYEDLIGQRMFELREPDSWHITTLYIGNDTSKLETDFYKKFRENNGIQIKLLSFVYIPGRLISAPVFVDYDLIENKYPHMTLILGGKSRPVDSNYLLKSVFFENENLRLLYENGSMKDPGFFFETELDNVNLDYEDIKQTEIFEKAYVIKSKYTVRRMLGKTKKNYE